MNTLEGKVAIITGTNSGFGYSTAQVFTKQGAAVVIGARRHLLDDLSETINNQGGQAIALADDVKDERYAKALVELACSHFGQLDIAFNNVGIIGESIATPDMALSIWQDTLNTNLNSAFLSAKYQLPAMVRQGRGSIIFTSSFVGHTVDLPKMAAYSASKAGLIGLTKSLAAEYGPKTIRVNALLPGATDTTIGSIFASTPEMLAFVEGLHTIKHRASPQKPLFLLWKPAQLLRTNDLIGLVPQCRPYFSFRNIVNSLTRNNCTRVLLIIIPLFTPTIHG